MQYSVIGSLRMNNAQDTQLVLNRGYYPLLIERYSVLNGIFTPCL